MLLISLNEYTIVIGCDMSTFIHYNNSLTNKSLENFLNQVCFDLNGVWVEGSKPVGRKSRNCKAEIFRQWAESCMAENTIRPKKFSSLLAQKLAEYYNHSLISRLL